MPSSRPSVIPVVIHLVRQLKPRSILDVGIGFGKWGHLFREYTDIIEAEHNPARYQKSNWRVRIDGIEAHSPYLTPMHNFLYDQIHVGDATALIKTLPNYDVIFLGDVIEHLVKHVGIELLRDAFVRANKAVIVSTPKYETGQENVCGNELERHRSLWTAKDFRGLSSAQVKTVDADTLVAVLPKSGLPELELRPRRSATRRHTAGLQFAREKIRQVIPAATKFVLVDEEQVRGTLRREDALPFLERDGQYWGPPEDDGTAISELERMRQNDAQFLVFISSTFWWLDHYQQFADYLRHHFKCTHQDEHMVVFDLRTSI